ncbi:endothelin-converting enzyme 2-like isoform X2 [Ornithodoros turicata]|uniref:endothelin-converting enzyme 2-like isoform X2 n=1 Tax=Ornithodoros turicata TaxID=34597 RepID=UPI0031397B89
MRASVVTFSFSAIEDIFVCCVLLNIANMIPENEVRRSRSSPAKCQFGRQYVCDDLTGKQEARAPTRTPPRTPTKSTSATNAKTTEGRGSSNVILQTAVSPARTPSLTPTRPTSHAKAKTTEGSPACAKETSGTPNLTPGGSTFDMKGQANVTPEPEDLTKFRDSALLKSLSSHLAERSLSSPTTSRRVPNYTFVIITLAVLLFAFGYLYFAYFARYVVHEQRLPLCETKACATYRGMLETSMNLGVNPCDNFYLYVCGTWEKNRNVPMYKQHLERFFKNLFNKLEETVPSQHQNAVQKAVRFFQSCRIAAFASRPKGGEYEVLRDIWTKCGIYWPHINKDANIPKTLICIFEAFYMSNVLGIAKRHDTLLPYVFPGEDMIRQHQYSLQIKQVNRYHEYYEGLRDLMKSADSTKEDDQAYDDFVRVENTIREQLLKEIRVSSETVRMNLSQLAELTPNISELRWEQVFKSEFHLEHTPVDVCNTEYIKGFNKVLGIIGEVELHRYIGWINVQQMAPYVNRKFFSVYAGRNDITVADLQTCLYRTESYMGWATFGSYATQYFDTNTREDMHHIIRSISRTVSQKQPCCTTEMENQSDVGSTVQRSLDELLFYADRFGDPQAMDVILSNISDMGNHVLLNWMDASKGFTKIDYDLFGSISSSFQPQMQQTYYTFFNSNEKRFLMPPYAAMLPLYHKNISNAVKYGALGSLVADAATKLLYDNYLFLPQKWRCFSDSVDGVRNDTEAAALSLHLAWKAFQSVAATGTRPLQTLSDAQLFFVAACLLMCGDGTDGTRFVHKCNEPLKRSVAFSEAFSCPRNSPMNSEEKCVFF